MKLASLILTALVVTGCARASAIQVSQNVVSITTDAAPLCGATGALGVAGKQAAIETIRRGYDRYIIMGGEHSSTLNVYGRNASTSHHQGLLVQMFKANEPGAEQAIDAKLALGPDWHKIALSDTITCF